MNGNNNLTQLLQWTQSRIGAKAAMRARFEYLLKHFEQKIDFPIIKVAGTNGKGSVSAMLSACLTEADKKVGLFTSPHLVSPTERFRIGYEEISEQELDTCAHEVGEQLRILVQRKGADFTPSYFEVLILIAIYFFSKNKVEIALFEAGVGGENDAVSLLPDFCALITSIGLDHQQQLGNTLEKIASDKAGIAQSGTLIINGHLDEELKNTIRNKARNHQLDIRVSADCVTFLPRSEKVAITKDDNTIELLPSLGGKFQKQNMDLVLETYQFLIDNGVLSSWKGIKGLEKTIWPGRFEKMGRHPRWIIDAAHNELGLQALIASLEEISKKEKRILIYGNSQEKDFKTLLTFVPALAPIVYLVDDFYKAVPREILLQNLDASVEAPMVSGVAAALKKVKNDFPDYIIVITGSIFMIGNARKWILTHGLDQ